ncbi:hypothetical protein RHSIM_Rhsim06G0084500 [Rhododendron simsii]|uniref:Endoplasmic reticulum vesicle transporter protein n=1 Tax=Rhododendron simsii TaxID=118357 RepID=A0A834GQC5_RHOSS|nr:hypothetical protein RHSIM_Rhsim06G0084500 [Rhododendron simsii]
MHDTFLLIFLKVQFDVTFPALPCSILSLDAMDISGERHLDVKHDIIKKRIDSHGNVIETRQEGIGSPKIEKPLQKHGGRLEHNETYCGSCFGAEASDDECCNSCEEVREAYRKKGWAVSNPDLIDQCKREGFLQRIKDEDGEGCNIYGFLEVNKVAGNFHFAPGKSFDHAGVHMHDLLAFQKDSFNVRKNSAPLSSSWICSVALKCVLSYAEYISAYETNKTENNMLISLYLMVYVYILRSIIQVLKTRKTIYLLPFISCFIEEALSLYQINLIQISHKINRLTFGEYFPGVVNPLDGVHWTQETPSGMYQYFVKVVPTVYTDVSGHTIQSNQFSVTEHFRSGQVGQLQSLPGVFFFYDLSPIKVTFTEEHVSFLHFLTSVCAIVGGVFTVSGILDSFIYHGQRAIKKKMEIGKFS